ncbi:DUF397 domain-containing protein [Streptomyces sp. XM4193]|uniref:DUF397 domain-containing protein n=1 Tax=Streptomyces sp. XM4193 TaxID=2929782 RepID=UPI001FF70284|nr:DUF397 domain-containing protein [Streptomyces sp. XM4193]MCK1796141.1 DUF397 domain-containing protein [Streptomyces sp. XM4193]
MNADEHASLGEWIKSSHSTSEGGQCLEWYPAHAGGCGPVAVRDSKRADGPVLRIPRSGWTGFVSALKNDAF